jgi:hypothetical protein
VHCNLWWNRTIHHSYFQQGSQFRDRNGCESGLPSLDAHVPAPHRLPLGEKGGCRRRSEGTARNGRRLPDNSQLINGVTSLASLPSPRGARVYGYLPYFANRTAPDRFRTDTVCEGPDTPIAGVPDGRSACVRRARFLLGRMTTDGSMTSPLCPELPMNGAARGRSPVVDCPQGSTKPPGRSSAAHFACL